VSPNGSTDSLHRVRLLGPVNCPRDVTPK
jgi:hypothetical protein